MITQNRQNSNARKNKKMLNVYILALVAPSFSPALFKPSFCKMKLEPMKKLDPTARIRPSQKSGMGNADAATVVVVKESVVEESTPDDVLDIVVV